MPSQKSLIKRDEKGPLPLVLAVTGHRDLRKEDYEPLKQQVRSIFLELAENYPFTPLQLFSGVAEGADRLAASVALECNISLVACLPMEKSLYESDFETSESREEFKTLLSAAARVVTLPLAGGSSTEQVKTHGPQRDAQYQALADYLVAQSQILVAFWDGTDTKLPGGTSSVVRMQLGEQRDGGDIDPEHPLDFPETGPVFHIVTPRIKNPTPAGKPYQIHKLWHLNPALNGARQSYLEIFSRIETFNRDALGKAGKLEKLLAKSKDWLLPEKVRAGGDESLAAMVHYYSLADTLSIHYQDLTRKSLNVLIFWSGLFAVFLFECFAHCPESIQIWALALYVIIVILTYGFYKIVKPAQFKTKYLDYRALAEGIRLQIFWRLAGLQQQVADFYLRKQKTELDWIRNAIRVWSTATHTVLSSPDFSLVGTYWIEDQLAFFNKASIRDHRRHKKEKRWTFWILFTTIGIALANLVLTLLFKEEFRHILSGRLLKGGIHDTFAFDVRALLVIVMAVLPAIAGAVTAYSLKMAISEQQKQYQRMRNLFGQGSKCLKQALKDKNEPLAVKTIFDLGKEALEENGDWVMLHRERSVELHLAG